MNVKDVRAKLGLAAVSTVLGLLALEFGLRLSHGAGQPEPVRPAEPVPDAIPLHVPVDAPYLYALNPDYPGINSHGLRGREFAVPKPPGVYRILVLGDSVTFGLGVGPGETFPERLESLLNVAGGKRVEVLNAGVSGYTAYNEWQYFRQRGRDFEPDLVISALCLNDVVDPHLHWNFTREAITNIPDEAVPNPDYARRHVLPLLRARARRAQEAAHPGNPDFLASSHVYGVLHRYLAPRTEDPPDVNAAVPTFITGEDSIGIDVLTKEDSPEMKWLMEIYARLHADVAASGARLCAVVLPLAYQLDESYPFLPQPLLVSNLERRGISCLDLLPSFRSHSARPLFPPQQRGRVRHVDVWHLTDTGHRVAAQAIAAHLHDRGIL